MKENPYFALCRSCTPSFCKKQSSPHQKATKSKKSIENGAIKIEEAGNKCQWCGSEKEPFSIHHPKEITFRTYDRIWDTIVMDVIAKSKGIDIKNAINDDEKKQVLGQAFIREVRKNLKPSKEHKELLKKYEKFLE